MLAKKPFEIKIALLGNTSAGKSTVLNALFRDNYAEVSTCMKGTTAGVDYFRIVSQTSTPTGVVEDEPQDAASTLEEITKDNALLRQKSNSDSDNTVNEKWFDVELDEDLFDMRKDTQLVLVDIPGINEAGPSKKYLNFVNDSWRKFDCVVLVLDGKQGVNTEEQILLLNLAKKNLKDKKDVPLVILCNKIDDPDDEQQDELVDEARKAVEEIFQVDDASPSSPPVSSIQFIPISAKYAYVHRTASRMSMESFKSFFDRDLIEELGRSQVGKRKWNRLTDEEKIKEVYEIVSSKQDVLQESNFEAFLSGLNRFAGGEDVQRGLIEKQFDVAITALQNQDFDFPNKATLSDQLCNILKEAQVLYGADAQNSLPIDLSDSFLKTYKRYEDECVEQFRRLGPAHINIMARAVDELLSFHELCQQMVSDQVGLDRHESANVFIRVKALLRRMIGVLLEQHNIYNGSTWMARRKPHDGTPLPAWARLSPLDWIRIWSSCLALSYDKHFCETFGTEKALLEERLHDSQELWSRFKTPKGNSKLCPCCGNYYTAAAGGDGDERCDSCKTLFLSPVPPTCFFCRAAGVTDEGLCMSTASHIDYCTQWRQLPNISIKEAVAVAYEGTTGRLQPSNLDHYSKIVHIEIPESFSNPSHIGHVVHRFCDFMNNVTLTKTGVFRHVFSTILEQEPNSCIMKSLHHCGYTSLDDVLAMDESAIDDLEYEGFDDKAKRNLESEHKELLLHFVRWAQQLKEKKSKRDLTLSEWLSLTMEDFQQYRKTIEQGVAAAKPQSLNAPQHAGLPNTMPSPASSSPQATMQQANLGVFMPSSRKQSYAGKTPREMLLAFYQDHNRSKIADVDKILAKYNGQEEALFRKLAMKYNVDVSIFGFSLGSPNSTSTTASPNSTTATPFGAPSQATTSPFGAASANSTTTTPFGPPSQATTRPFGSPVSPTTCSFFGTATPDSTPRTSNVSAPPPASPFGSSTSPRFGTPLQFGLSVATAPARSPTGFGSAVSSSLFGSSSPFGGTGNSTNQSSGATSTLRSSAPSTPFGSVSAHAPLGPAFASTATTTVFGSPAASSPGPANSPNQAFGFANMPPVLGGSAPFGAPVSSPSFGTAAPDRGIVGTRGVAFQPTNRPDGNATIQLQSISSMDQYNNKSFEELRFEDYLQ